VLIGAGLLMLWTRLAPPPAGVPPIPASEHEGALNDYAIFGGVERKVTTDDFRGGHVSAMFGGVEVDLRRAGMRGDSAVVDVSAMFGGVEQDSAELGGGTSVAAISAVCNRAQPNGDVPEVKRLFIKGSRCSAAWKSELTRDASRSKGADGFCCTSPLVPIRLC
jgi:hypothetical protein